MTKSHAGKSAMGAANFGFSALLFALFGWLNLEVLLLSASAGIRGHLLTFAFGASLSTIAYRRYRTWWVPLARSAQLATPRMPLKAKWIASGCALAGAGFVMAYMMRMGFFTSVLVGAGILTFIPWARSSFCRAHFFISHVVLVGGGLPLLVIDVKHQHPLVPLGATWTLWVLAAGLLLITLWPQKSAVSPAAQLQAGPRTYEDSIQ